MCEKIEMKLKILQKIKPVLEITFIVYRSLQRMKILFNCLSLSTLRRKLQIKQKTKLKGRILN